MNIFMEAKKRGLVGGHSAQTRLKMHIHVQCTNQISKDQRASNKNNLRSILLKVSLMQALYPYIDVTSTDSKISRVKRINFKKINKSGY